MNTVQETVKDAPLIVPPKESTIRTHMLRVSLGAAILFNSPSIFRTLYQYCKSPHTLTTEDLKTHSLFPSGIFTRDGLSGIACYNGEYRNVPTTLLMQYIDTESSYKQSLEYLAEIRYRIVSDEKKIILDFLMNTFENEKTDTCLRYLIAQILVVNQCHSIELVEYFQSGTQCTMNVDPKYTISHAYSCARSKVNIPYTTFDDVFLRRYGNHIDIYFLEKSLRSESLYCLQLLAEYHPNDLELQKIYQEAKHAADELERQ